ncbi:MAG: sugar phosphate nucleotidyltransferase [Henriciella sp.]|uniref:mannose-1-phosphate guanylyltransferase n=1 Tax=Henriciella sp. TaxID=1968823 RepID=UPI003C767E39
MQTLTIRPVILCGGSGTRLWPLSTPEVPKQFLKLDGEETMLAKTASRMIDDAEQGLAFRSPMIVGAARHEALMKAELPEAVLILEPFGRNSAAAVAAAALTAHPEELLLVLPADHSILRPDRFRRAIRIGASAAAAGDIVTFGITPDFPSTGYGYIEIEQEDRPVLKAVKFEEKPPLEKAKHYIEAGHYLWNAGIFLFEAGAMVKAFEAHAPDVLQAVRDSLPASDGESTVHRIDADKFGACPEISVDYAIMEKHPGVRAVPVDMGWNDVGDYKALWELSDKDEDGNALLGPVTAIDCKHCYIRSEGRPISVSGLRHAIIVATEDNYMVCAMDDAQKVKALAQAARR